MKIVHKARKDLDSVVVIFPDCCPLSARGNGPMLYFNNFDTTEEEEQTNPPSRKPQWSHVYTRYNFSTLFAMLRHHENRMNRAEPVLDDGYKIYRQTQMRFCPFCATVLPEPVYIPAPAGLKIQRWCDSGYCATCNERCDNCRCWHPLIEWDIKKPQEETTP
jgi:hypothetical protein